MSSVSFYKGRAEFGVSMIARTKTVEEENRRLKKMFAERGMQDDLLKGLSEKTVRPSHRHETAGTAAARRGVSMALACRALGVSETCYRHGAKRRAENAEIADLLVGLTDTHKTWGFGLCFLHLRNVKGHPWNHKRVCRIDCALELTLRIQPRKRLKRDKPDALAVPDAPNMTWAMQCPVASPRDAKGSRQRPPHRVTLYHQSRFPKV